VTYNARFNNLVLRNYDDASLSLPGLAVTFTPRPHQVAAVARMISEPAVLLAHEVGAGKTAEMIMGTTELRRLGLARKPAIVVPNHMLDQFAREWLQLYPQACILVARRDDLQTARRREFVARCATGSWDGIVMSRSAFERIPLSPRYQRDYLDRELGQPGHGLLRSPDCPRTGGTFDAFRRAAMELSGFLNIDAPGGGRDPAVLTAAHIQRFAADQRHREREGLASRVMRRPDGTPSVVTATTRSITFNHARKLLRWALEAGAAERAGLSREFITAMPAAGGIPLRKRSPFPDEVARALAGEANLSRLAEVYDPADFGLRDIWETIIVTGRRVGEVLRLRLDCTGRYGGLAMLWHDQTKVGRYDQAIRIPEPLFARLAARRETTLCHFITRHGHAPTSQQRAAMALFPGRYRNPDGTAPVTYQWFHVRFRAWADELDIGRWVPHQARHTLATSLLRHGASLTHIRRYLGHVSDRMAEHYIQLSHSDLEDVLQHVWVAGPGTASPGTLLSSPAAPLTREQARALAIDLSRRGTTAEGGFCTFQPVVDGGACPWNLDCHNCDKFVLSGADLLYWRRKREQWYSIAERAPDNATASWLHQVFAPTAAAIDGLEVALAGLGLLDDALALDLRRPQDYFQRVWNIGFRATQLASAPARTDPIPGEQEDADGDELEETA
jgi:integrase